MKWLTIPLRLSMVKAALAVVLASGCTILGASGGALVGAQSDMGKDTGHDALVGGAIGAVVDVVVVVMYFVVQSNNTVGGR